MLTDLLLGLLTGILEKSAGALRAWADNLRQQAAIRRTLQVEREATENAKTEEERTNAADNNRRM